MSIITISTAEGIGSAPIYAGLSVTGTAMADDTVRVYYTIPQNGVMSADLNTTADINGMWSVTFDSEFYEGNHITVLARLDDKTQTTFDVTLSSVGSGARVA